jgi:hypothetical protein
MFLKQGNHDYVPKCQTIHFSLDPIVQHYPLADDRASCHDPGCPKRCLYTFKYRLLYIAHSWCLRGEYTLYKHMGIPIYFIISRCPIRKNSAIGWGILERAIITLSNVQVRDHYYIYSNYMRLKNYIILKASASGKLHNHTILIIHPLIKKLLKNHPKWANI